MNPRSNQLLDQLTDAEYQLLHRDLQLVSLQAGQTLFIPGGTIDQAYFPVNALIAIANQLSGGQSIDMALVGSEGSVGLRGLFENICPYQVYVANSGLSYKIGLARLRQLFDSGAWVHKIYIQANHQILGQIAAETTCAHFHGVLARLARWILIRTARLEQTYLEATHQSVADCLGVRREAVTHALMKLPGIQCHRNHIEVNDRSDLEHQACGCYQKITETLTGQMTLPFRKQA